MSEKLTYEVSYLELSTLESEKLNVSSCFSFRIISDSFTHVPLFPFFPVSRKRAILCQVVVEVKLSLVLYHVENDLINVVFD